MSRRNPKRKRKRGHTHKPKRKPNRKKQTGLSIGLIGFLLLLIWEVDLYRETFISLWTALVIYIGGGSIAFFLLRNRMRNYKRRVETYGIWWTTLAGIFFSGGVVLTLVMTLNYYIPLEKKPETIFLKVIKTGRFGGRGSKDPYVIVDYNGFEKQLVFDYSTDVINSKLVKVSLRKGIFGFRTVRSASLIYSYDADEKRASQQILNQARKYELQGNIPKAIERYQRAVRFNPSDSLTKTHVMKLNRSLTFPAN
ncbi:tetratricopeptide repeat protein [Fluviicola sp.]|uniref:tetratricopeptide repeat protein n=1 Tax=Fluviicola sp. TaxID=1917219 RepID=UPI0031DA6631